MIDAVAERAHQLLPADHAEAAATFIRHYYRWLPEADLKANTQEDLYGAAIAHWNLAQQRNPGELKLRIYNPENERDGWSSPHTVLELVCDDMPFLVDSVAMEITRLGYDPHLVIHPMIRVQRDAEGRLLDVIDADNGASGVPRESVMHVELDREPDPDKLADLRANVERILRDIEAAVRDWKPMRTKAEQLADESPDKEAGEFLRWLAASHFTFLGYREYKLTPATATSPPRLEAIPESGLGLLAGPPRTPVTELSPAAAKLAFSSDPLLLTKANSRSTVHRPAYLDYVGVKRFGPDGSVIGERRFLGLYTTAAYRADAASIPLIRDKVKAVLDRAGFPPDSHDAKLLAEICESHPRDALLQISTDQLVDTALGILGLGQRQQVRVFFRPDQLGRFVDCTVCMPRDRYNRDTRNKAGQVLLEHFKGTHFDWTLQIGESRIATVHMLVHTPQGLGGELDAETLQARIATAIRAWSQDLHDALVETKGDLEGRRLAKRYEEAFPPAYQEAWPANQAQADIAVIEDLVSKTRSEPVLKLYHPSGSATGTARARLLSPEPVSLSRALEVFAHMGARVADEQPHEIRPADTAPVYLYDFGLECKVTDVDQVAPRFAEVFGGVWRGDLENDGLGELALTAGLHARQILVLRAVAKYLRQAGIPFSERYVERTLVDNPEIATLLVRLFEARNDPEARDESLAAELGTQLDSAVDAVKSLDEDRILRAFRSVIDAILRTNHYQHGPDNKPKPYLSLKLDPSAIPTLPHPRPKFEIFVYSPRVEGVHLRGGAVARGGLRWSDRREDFRTEILGLMKAQMVKNALIVPVGSKGGFVVKRPPADPGREAQQKEGIACYRTFLSGLLDLTDNIVEHKVVAPPNVVRHDGDDPYLVVAADKGTATFSDIANGVSADYGFWLGDAFASGGSVGYDHKAMGITARGAWESVKRHFRELGTDIQSTDFSVVGVGDMAGDVFGNGMLLSEHIRLLAAFNHMHIFLDPNPDAAASYAERKRLFELPRSAWTDYNAELISAGGGVFERSAKEIPLSSEIRAVLGIEAETLTPTELISAILRAPVDLLWNGGIGTYVKAASETHHDVGDRANDALRVNGSELRARVVGEGGNLGFTQLGRIEYALGGGRINTDAIDNVAGVNCSDHEVNIKILLDSVVTSGGLDGPARNSLLAEMTDAVGERVLYGSYRQSQALSLALIQASQMANVHARLIRELEASANLDRALEYLPSEKQLVDRQKAGAGLVSPELAVVMAYTKVHLDAELLDSDLPEDPYLAQDLQRYFPDPLPGRFGEQLSKHRLRREIIATSVANELVDRMGTSFRFRLGEETGVPASVLARAYAVAREIFGMREFWSAVEALDTSIDAQTQLSMLSDGRRLVERATRWLVRRYPQSTGGCRSGHVAAEAGPSIDIEELVARYRAGAELLWEAGPDLLDDEDQARFTERVGELESGLVPGGLARQVASMDSMLAALDTVEVSQATGANLAVVLELGRRAGAQLSLSWLARRITELPRADRWQALARSALRDDLATMHRSLTLALLSGGSGGADTLIAAWRERHEVALQRYLAVISDIRESGTYDMTTLPVALRELRNLAG
ncbi:MAG: NAD-glutamate dehydrogenase [Solirubrobacterales bacterium]|nr:NAD-glutamate dehydrogenase [Solirubrobacterales bacterium]